MFEVEANSLYRRQKPLMTQQGKVLSIVSWILLAFVLCVFIARFAIKLSIRGRRNRLGFDDLFITLAALCSFGQTIIVAIESMNGLGQQTQLLTIGQTFILLQKADYAANLLYIANMGCARIAICLLIRKVLQGSIPKYTARTFASITAIWTVSGMLTSAFPCSLPNPWKFSENTRCYNLLAFLKYTAITNIVLDIMLFIIPLLLWNIRLSVRKRASVALIFSIRLSIVAAVSAQLHFLNRLNQTNHSSTYWAAILCQQIAQNISVISACILYLHPLISSILGGTLEAATIESSMPPWVEKYLNQRHARSDSKSSQHSLRSRTRLGEKISEPYCRPLATYDFDRGTNYGQTNAIPHFRPNIAKPVFIPRLPANVFNRPVEVPRSSSATPKSSIDSSSLSRDLNDVGVLPILEENFYENSRRSSPLSCPTVDYVFSRRKVVSISEEIYMYDEGSKVFDPPLPSPKMPEQARRAS